MSKHARANKKLPEDAYSPAALDQVAPGLKNSPDDKRKAQQAIASAGLRRGASRDDIRKALKTVGLDKKVN